MSRIASRLTRTLAIVALAAAALPAMASTVSGSARVVDGDTIAIQGQRIRLHGINAPESDQTCSEQGRAYACGQVATQAMREAIGNRPVTCQGRERDHYGRLVAVCHNAWGEDLSRRMVDEGWATAYRRYSHDYVSAESRAKRLGLGVWAGEFQDPESFNHGGALSSSRYESGASVVGQGIGSAVGAVKRGLGVLVESTATWHQGPITSDGPDYGPLYPHGEPARQVRPSAYQAQGAAPSNVYSLASDGYTQGDRVEGAGGLSGRQFCALAELAGKPCR